MDNPTTKSHIEYVNLIGGGLVAALPVSDLRIGDTLIWNYGSRSELVAITPKGSQSVTLTTRTSDGKLWSRSHRLTTLVACERAREAEKALPREERDFNRRVWDMMRMADGFRLTRDVAERMVLRNDEYKAGRS